MPDFSFTRQKLNAWNTGYLMLNFRPCSDLPLNLAQGLCLVSVKVRLETTNLLETNLLEILIVNRVEQELVSIRTTRFTRTKKNQEGLYQKKI